MAACKSIINPMGLSMKKLDMTRFLTFYDPICRTAVGKTIVYAGNLKIITKY